MSELEPQINQNPEVSTIGLLDRMQMRASAFLASGAIAIGGGVAVAEASYDRLPSSPDSSEPHKASSFEECSKLSEKVKASYKAFSDLEQTSNGQKMVTTVKTRVKVPDLGSCAGKRKVTYYVTNIGRKISPSIKLSGNEAGSRKDSLKETSACPGGNDLALVYRTTYKQSGEPIIKTKDIVQKPQYDRAC